MTVSRLASSRPWCSFVLSPKELSFLDRISWQDPLRRGRAHEIFVTLSSTALCGLDGVNLPFYFSLTNVSVGVIARYARWDT